MRRRIMFAMCAVLLICSAISCQQESPKPSVEPGSPVELPPPGAIRPIKVAVVTGSHAFDVPNFYKLFRNIEGIDAYPQHIEHFASSEEAIRDSYDVVLFYGMERGEAPDDDNAPHYAGKPKAALERLLENGQGVVIMHHAILAWEKWPLWDEVIGFSERNFGWKEGLDLNVVVTDAEHPIVDGLEDFAIIDEGYKLHGEHDGKGDMLLTVEHDDAMPEVAWSRTCRNSRVFCLALGHDDQAWSTPAFQEVVRRGIAWAAENEPE